MQKAKFPPNDLKIIAQKYQILKKLKSGGFGSVFIAKSILSDDPKKYAIKLLPKKHERYANIEIQMYKLFSDKKFTLGVIKYYEHGFVDDQIYLAMELIGYDLEDIMTKMKNNKFSVKTVIMIALQVIDRIQALHKIGYVHRDIKPDNLAVGNKEGANIIYLFDFGLAIKASASLPTEQKGKMIGTLAFLSLRGHQGRKATFYDDLQSFVYSLVYMLMGSLPWMNIVLRNVTDYQRVKAMKEKLSKDWFQKNQIPLQFYQILQIAREGGKNDQKLDYLNLKYKLMSSMHKIKQENDFDFDWTGKMKVSYDRQESPIKRAEQKKKINEMNKSNQKIVQNQIYEVYKFMDLEKKEEKKTQSPKKQKIKEGKQLERRQSQRKIEKQKQKQKQKVYKKEQPKRPFSSKPNKKGQNLGQKGKVMNQIEMRLKQIGKLSFNGPRITINETANYRL